MVLSSIEKKRQFCIIGPAPPYRGGIANYTSTLASTIAQVDSVKILNFYRLYPTIFFPGSTQYTEYRPSEKLTGTRQLSSVNPDSWIAVARYLVRLHPAAVIFQWWHPFFAPTYFVISRYLKRAEIPGIYICHNVIPHESSFIDRWLLRLAYREIDLFVVQSETERHVLKLMRPSAKVAVNVHPEYPAFPVASENVPPPVTLPKVDLLLLFFGFIREYKGLEYLIKALPLLENRVKIHLLVAGEFYEDRKKYERLVHSCGVERHITIVDQYIPDEEVGWYFQQADVVVLPYLSATQSGIIPLSYHFKKPVITTKVGGLPEVVFEGKTGYLVPPGDSLALAEAIIKYHQEKNHTNFQRWISQKLSLFSWNRLRDTIYRLLDR